MKKLLSILLFLIATIASAQSQETFTDYPSGYAVTSYYMQGNTIKSIDGVLYMVYDNIPVVLVKYPAMNPRETFEIPSTVRRIMNNAFQGTKYLRTLKMHSTVTFGKFIQLAIGESAFNDASIENFVVIEDNQTTTAMAPSVSPDTPSSASSSPQVTGRYDMAGRPATDQTKGVQIVTYDDNTAKKVIK